MKHFRKFDEQNFDELKAKAASNITYSKTLRRNSYVRHDHKKTYCSLKNFHVASYIAILFIYSLADNSAN